MAQPAINLMLNIMFSGGKVVVAVVSIIDILAFLILYRKPLSTMLVFDAIEDPRHWMFLGKLIHLIAHIENARAVFLSLYLINLEIYMVSILILYGPIFFRIYVTYDTGTMGFKSPAVPVGLTLCFSEAFFDDMIDDTIAHVGTCARGFNPLRS
ncbi:hypothetical protein ACJX0J_037483 [Zea mays]